MHFPQFLTGRKHGSLGTRILQFDRETKLTKTVQKQVAQLSQKDRARFVSLNILLSHSRPFEMTLLSRVCVSPYWYFIATMSACRTVYETFSVKEWRNLKMGVGVVQGN